MRGRPRGMMAHRLSNTACAQRGRCEKGCPSRARPTHLALWQRDHVLPSPPTLLGVAEWQLFGDETPSLSQALDQACELLRLLVAPLIDAHRRGLCGRVRPTWPNARRLMCAGDGRAQLEWVTAVEAAHALRLCRPETAGCAGWVTARYMGATGARARALSSAVSRARRSGAPCGYQATLTARPSPTHARRPPLSAAVPTKPTLFQCSSTYVAAATMPPKFDPNSVLNVYVRAVGGEIGAASSLAPKIGPLGLSPKKVGEDIAKATGKDWKGLRVTVKLVVQNRQAKVEVVPTASALVIKALKEPVRDRKKVRRGRERPLAPHVPCFWDRVAWHPAQLHFRTMPRVPRASGENGSAKLSSAACAVGVAGRVAGLKQANFSPARACTRRSHSPLARAWRRLVRRSYD